MTHDQNKRAFNAMRNAPQHSSLLSESELSELTRQVSPLPANSNRFAKLVLLGGSAAVLLVTVWVMWPTEDVSVLTPGQSVSTARDLEPKQAEALQPPLAQADAMVGSTANETAIPPGNVTRPRVSDVNADGGDASIAATAPSATIAGVHFLELSYAEFAALPASALPELLTHKLRVLDADGSSIDTKWMECLQPNPDSKNVLFNGEEFVQRRAVYIPIRVLQRSTTSKTETTAWYKPTSSLIAALPDRYRVPLLIEMNLMNEVSRGCITTDEACKSIPHAKSFLDMCRLDSPIISNVTVFPNPTLVFTNVSVELSEVATLVVELYTSNGNFVTDLTRRQEFGVGSHVIPVQFSGIGSGVYLLTVTSSRGEHVVRQVVVN